MRIFDTFTFFNELDLLDIRLNVLNDVVDRFVIVEATRTFQNREKPLYFEENKGRFAKFLSKITHIIVDDMPNSNNTRVLEAHQRNSIERGLTICQPGDKIMLSDLDEIPSPEKIRSAMSYSGRIQAFRQSLYYYFLNYACQELPDLPWTIMSNFEDFTKPQEMRQRLISAQAMLLSGSNEVDIELIENGGWHFSYLGGINAIIIKLRSFADPKYNRPLYQDYEKISYAVSQGLDLFGRNLHFIKMPVDESFPMYIRINKKQFEKIIHE